MVGEVNVITMLGPSGAGHPLPDSGEAAAPADFAALLDEAAIEVPPTPEAQPGKDASVAQPFIPVFVAEWNLGSDAVVAVQPERAFSGPVDEIAEAPIEDEGENDDAPQLEGVLNIDWLLAQPKRMPAAGQTEDAAPVINDRTEPAVVQPRVATPQLVQGEDAPAIESASGLQETTPVAPAGIDVPMDDVAATVAKSSMVPAERLPAAKATNPRPEVQANKVEAQPAVASPMPEVAAQPAAGQQAVSESPATAERSTNDVPKPNGASTRLAKAIERIMGGISDAAQLKATATANESASNDLSSFSSSRENTAPFAAPPVRVATAAAPAFTVHVSQELSRAVEAAAHAVEAPLPTSAPDVPDADTVRQLVQTMRMQFRNGIGDAVLKLRPEHLGEVSISLRVDQQSVSATVQAEVASVRQWLESQEGLLRSGLAEQGLHLEEFVVREDAERQQQQADHEEAQRRNRQARRRREGEPRFEITV